MPKLTTCAPPFRSISSTMSIGSFFSASAIAAMFLPCHFGFLRVPGDLDALAAVAALERLLDVRLRSAARSSGRRAGRRSPSSVPSRYRVGTSVAAQRRAAGDVRVLVGRHLLAGLAGRLDQRDGVGRTCPTPPCRDALMCEMWTGSPASGRCVSASSMASSRPAALVADVAGVDAAVLRRRPSPGRPSRPSSSRCRGCRSGRWPCPRRRPSSPARPAPPSSSARRRSAARLALPMTCRGSCCAGPGG